MPLTVGSRLGPYDILSALGSGGFGEVYKARDTRLDRTVAIKILPSADSELKARFEREAKAIAALQHPHICTLYDVGHQDGTDYLVMEHLEGETLADRLTRGPLKIDEALKTAIDIADALDAAHRAGFVHRDLKPANVMLTKSGATLLDFGLAKLRPQAPITGFSMATTQDARPLTSQGSLLGTLQYMAPEQVEGKDADARSDIFAFGALVYEMLTGKRAFEGKSQASVIAAILDHDPPPLSTLKPLTPPVLDRLVRKCLAKDPHRRWQSASDLHDELVWVADTGARSPSSAAVALPQPARRPRWVWPSAVALLVAGLVALAIVHFRERPPAAPALMRFQISLPENAAYMPGGQINLSPDGRRLAFFATSADGVPRIWVRALDSLESRPLPGSETDGAVPPFWSPDSRFIAFQDGGKLKKLDVAGGPAQTICDLSSTIVLGGTWNEDGVIIFGTLRGGLMRVPAAGGLPTALTMPDASRGEANHVKPQFLPDGRHFQYLRLGGSEAPDTSGLYVGSLDASPESPASRRLLATTVMPSYIEATNLGRRTGYLLFLRERTLMVQAFDAERQQLSGEPVPVAEQLGSYFNAGVFSASSNGVLVYGSASVAGADRSLQLTWFDAQGKVLGLASEAGFSGSPALAPNGTRAAVSRVEPSGTRDLWLIDFARGTRTRFTVGPTINDRPIWSPDGTHIVFRSLIDRFNLYQKLTNGAADQELLLKSSETKTPTSWSGDGRFVLYSVLDATLKSQLWVLPMDGDRKPRPFLRSKFNEDQGRFSPDGRWVAYVSDESGRSEIYVREFSPDAGGGTWLVSKEGGTNPRWRGDGKVLFYAAPDGTVMAADVTVGVAFQTGLPKALFKAPPSRDVMWDVTADGRRFLVPVPAVQSAPATFTVVVNWQGQLRK